MRYGVQFLLLIWTLNVYAGLNVSELFQQQVGDQNISLVTDSPFKKVESILLFLANRATLKMQSSLINKMGQNTQFHIVITPEIDEQEIVSQINFNSRSNLHFYSYDNCFTPWVQDYFLRMSDGQRFYLVPTYSDNLQNNECKPFELGVSNLLENQNSQFQKLNSDLFQGHRVDRKNGDLYDESTSYKKLFPVDTFKLFYGEGGMRIPTKSYFFIERTDWAALVKRVMYYSRNLTSEHQVREYVELVFKKKVILVGSSLADRSYYSYHIDMFLTPIEFKQRETVIFLGHPQETVDVLGIEKLSRMKGFSKQLWDDKTIKANLIENELVKKGFKVVRLPILFLEGQNNQQIITFNNVIQSLDDKALPTLYVPQYDLPNEFENMQILKNHVKQKFSFYNLETQFIEGGEQLLDLNGQLRCSTAVLRNDP
jgi:hypothetical protein